MTRKLFPLALGAIVLVFVLALASGAGAAPPVCDPEDTECGGGGEGPVTRNAELTVVAPSGGSIQSNPTGISCGTDCTETWTYTLDCSVDVNCQYDDVTTVVLTVSGGPFGYAADWSVCNANATGAACSSTAPDVRNCDTETGTQCTMAMKGNYRIQLTWVDTQPPLQPTVTGPDEIGPGSATFTAAASDNSGAVTRMAFFVDSVSVGQDTTAPFQHAVTGTTFGHGTNHTVSARAFDAAGNQSAVAGSKSFTVDRATSVAIDSPAAGGHFDSAPQFAFTIDGDATATCRTLAGLTGETVLHSAPCAGTYTPQASSPGDYRVRVSAIDDMGNAATAERSFTIDPAAGPPPAGPTTDDPPAGRTVVRSLSIGFRKGKVRGQVKPGGGCAAFEQVKLLRVRKGTDPVVGRDRTDANGRYVIAKPGGVGRFYAKVLRSSNGSDTCAASRSRALIFAAAG